MTTNAILSLKEITAAEVRALHHRLSSEHRSAGWLDWFDPASLELFHTRMLSHALMTTSGVAVFVYGIKTEKESPMSWTVASICWDGRVVPISGHCEFSNPVDAVKRAFRMARGGVAGTPVLRGLR